MMNMMKSHPKYPFQVEINKFSKTQTKIGFFIFFGGGKTYLSLQWLDYRLHIAQAEQLPYPLPALVLSLKDPMIAQWEVQVKEHSNFRAIGVRGSADHRLSLLKTDADIYIVNYDIVRSKPVRDYLANRTTHRPYQTFIIDESIAFKEARILRFKVWRMLLQHIPYRAILSGRPITEAAENLWSQMLLLDSGQTFGRSFWKFRDYFFAPGPPWAPYDWTLKAGAEKDIAQRCSNHCIYVPKKVILDQLPPKVFNKVYFDMPTHLKKMYNQLK